MAQKLLRKLDSSSGEPGLACQLYPGAPFTRSRPLPGRFRPQGGPGALPALEPQEGGPGAQAHVLSAGRDTCSVTPLLSQRGIHTEDICLRV